MFYAAHYSSIIAMHGLDAKSPDTWIAWKEDGNPASGDVHWLRDDDMLPRSMPNSRILTYDWNANYAADASSDKFLGHADALLDRIYVDREDTVRPGPQLRSCTKSYYFIRAD